MLGPWGSGKTTFVNFVRGELATLGVPILDFNPWMFSGAQALVDAFFVEISSQLKLKRELKEVGADLEAYGEALNGLGWIPLV
ncbi:KAP family P-loop domain protein, partial [Mycobacterium intracellulare MIN_061107_1834]